MEPRVDNAVHCVQWVTVLGAPRLSERVSRWPSGEFLAALLDAFVEFTKEGLEGVQDGRRVNWDPTGAFHRAGPLAIVLREQIEQWEPASPGPQGIVTAARRMVDEFDSPARGNWDNYDVPADFETLLLWEEED